MASSSSPPSAALFILLLFPFFVLSSSDLLLDPEEQNHLYDVLYALNPSVQWRADYPDDLCTSGPHGIVCEPVGDTLHVVELSFGFVSDYSNNPSCNANNASFSPSLARFPFLTKLFFYRCFTSPSPAFLPSFLPSIGQQQQQLQELVFQDNPSLSGRIPDNLSNLTGLRRLIISGSNLTGSIPESLFRSLTQAQQIDLSGNRLSGPIPSTIAGLASLVVLDLSRNFLSGSIPFELGHVSAASKIDLSFNNLTGAIPSSLGELKNLEMLLLSYNGLGGGVPVFLQNMTGLSDFHLRGNPLGGPIPDVWAGLASLSSVDLAYTGLVGSIPRSMASLRNLAYLSLEHNALTGSIPSGFGAIHHLDLSYNGLDGLVPFGREMVERLGPKLRLDGNTGLCLGPETVGAGSSVKLDLGGCIVAASTLSESLARDLPMPTSSICSPRPPVWFELGLVLVLMLPISLML